MSSNKIKAPNEKNNGFAWAIGVVILVIAVIIGFVVYNNRSSDEPSSPSDIDAKIKLDGSAVQLKKDGVGSDVPVVDIYDDFSCPHCAELEKDTGSDVLDAINQGKLVVNVRSMHFLDGKEKDGHSTKSVVALYTLAKAGDAQHYWDFRNMLFEKQSEIYGKWGYDDMANAAKDMGASDDVVKDIKDAKYRDEATKMSEDNQKKLAEDGEDGKVSSPRVFVNGKELDLKANSNGSFENWVPQAETGKVD